MGNVLLWDGPCRLNLDKSYYKDLELYSSIRKGKRGSWSIKLQDPAVKHGIRAKSTILRFGTHPERFDLSGGLAYVKIIRRKRDKIIVIEEPTQKADPEPTGMLTFMSAETDISHTVSVGDGLYVDLSSGGVLEGVMTLLAVVSDKPLMMWESSLTDETIGTLMVTYTFENGSLRAERAPFRDRQGNRMLQLPDVNGSEWVVRPKPKAIEAHRKHKAFFVQPGVHVVRLRMNKTDLIGREIKVI